MAKKHASLYSNNEIAGNGGTRYVKGTQISVHCPQSQENVHLTKSYKQFMPQLMGAISIVIDPNSAQALQPWLYNAIPRFKQVNVIRDSKGNITTDFNIQKENTITNGVYSVAVRNVEDQAPVTIVIASQWVEDGDKWKYYRNGDFVTADWVQVGEKWYYIGADKYMVTGLQIIDGKQYYFKKKEEDLENKNNYGQMIAHKWWRIDGTWYYFHADGTMLTNGWRMDAAGTDWYYCGADGKMVENQVIPWNDGKLYYVGHGGAMVKNTTITDTDTGKTYEADGNGVLTLKSCKGDYKDFRDAVGLRESSNNYQAVNQYGYMGRYQFGLIALQDIGFKDKNKQWTDEAEKHGVKSDQDFLNNPSAQDKAFELLVKKQLSYIKAYKLDKYIGQTMNGIEITESGLVAASHLIGVGGIKKALNANDLTSVKDGNGVAAKEYVDLFGGYDLSEVK